MYVRIRSTTREPTQQARGGFIGKWRDAWQGSTEAESEVGPGVHVLTPEAGFNRRQVEAMHNWALAHGYESELTEFSWPTVWELRVRAPGTADPTFMEEELGFRPS